MDKIKKFINLAFEGNVNLAAGVFDSILKDKSFEQLSEERRKISKHILTTESILPVISAVSNVLSGATAAKNLLSKAKEEKPKPKEETVKEELKPGMKASNIIHDFVHSDNPKFKGKSKQERIKMALGAFYGLKTKNEELQQISERVASKDFMGSMIKNHYDYRDHHETVADQGGPNAQKHKQAANLHKIAAEKMNSVKGALLGVGRLSAAEKSAMKDDAMKSSNEANKLTKSLHPNFEDFSGLFEALSPLQQREWHDNNIKKHNEFVNHHESKAAQLGNSPLADQHKQAANLHRTAIESHESARAAKMGVGRKSPKEVNKIGLQASLSTRNAMDLSRNLQNKSPISEGILSSMFKKKKAQEELKPLQKGDIVKVHKNIPGVDLVPGDSVKVHKVNDDGTIHISDHGLGTSVDDKKLDPSHFRKIHFK